MMTSGFRWPWQAAARGKAAPAARDAVREMAGGVGDAGHERKAAGGPLSLVDGDRPVRWSGRSYQALARDGFMGNPVAHRAIRLIAEAAASIPWLVYGPEGELERHPALDLLRHPGGDIAGRRGGAQRIAGADFLETLYGQLMLAGNAYVEAVLLDGAPRALHALRPDRIAIIEGADGWAQRYDYRAGQRIRRIEAEGGTLLHLKLFHPLDDRLGLSPLAAARMALDLHNAAARWNKALLDNSARPSGALVYQPKDGGNLSADQYERLKEELDEGYSGPMRAGRPLLLEGGLDWKAMGLSPKDMDFAEARNGAAREIALACGVPPMLLAIPGDNTYANYQEANRAFWRLTVLPLAARTAGAFSGFLSGLYDEDLRIEPDLDRAAGLVAERDALWARIGAADFLTDAEKRAAVGY